MAWDEAQAPFFYNADFFRIDSSPYEPFLYTDNERWYEKQKIYSHSNAGGL